MKNLDKIFKKLALLIDYPYGSISNIREIGVRASGLMADFNHLLVPYVENFLNEIADFSNTELQEHYTKTFDFSEKTTLYLTYHILKDNKKRGELLIEIAELYKKEGFNFPSKQLPDYLPDVLSFLSFYAERNNLHGIEDFSDKYINKGLERISTGLVNLKSPYLHLINLINEVLTNGGRDGRFISV